MAYLTLHKSIYNFQEVTWINVKLFEHHSKPWKGSFVPNHGADLPIFSNSKLYYSLIPAHQVLSLTFYARYVSNKEFWVRFSLAQAVFVSLLTNLLGKVQNSNKRQKLCILAWKMYQTAIILSKEPKWHIYHCIKASTTFGNLLDYDWSLLEGIQSPKRANLCPIIVPIWLNFFHLKLYYSILSTLQALSLIFYARYISNEEFWVRFCLAQTAFVSL